MRLVPAAPQRNTGDDTDHCGSQTGKERNKQGVDDPHHGSAQVRRLAVVINKRLVDIVTCGNPQEIIRYVQTRFG